jgi:hypothetical protein
MIIQGCLPLKTRNLYTRTSSESLAGHVKTFLNPGDLVVPLQPTTIGTPSSLFRKYSFHVSVEKASVLVQISRGVPQNIQAALHSPLTMIIPSHVMLYRPKRCARLIWGTSDKNIGKFLQVCDKGWFIRPKLCWTLSHKASELDSSPVFRRNVVKLTLFY